jgi:hypothetical protein
MNNSSKLMLEMHHVQLYLSAKKLLVVDFHIGMLIRFT